MDKSKKLTKAELYWHIIGGTIGSGLFVCLPSAIGYAGKGVVLAVIISSILVFCAASYGVIISALFPLRGGDYSQIAFITPPVVSGVYGLIWVISCIAIASYSTTAVFYLADIIPALAPYSKAIAIGITTFFFALNYFGTKTNAKIESAMTVVLIVSLLIFSIVGVTKMDLGNFVAEGGFMEHGVAGLFGAMGMCVWAVQGPAICGVGIAAEVENPTREVPKAILGGTVICTIFTLLVSLVCVGLVPAAEVAAMGDLTLAAKAVFPGAIYVIFVIGAAVCALLTSLQANITMFRYPFFQLTDEGWLPKVFNKTTKNGWPWVVMVVMYVLAIAPVAFDISIDTVIAYCTMPCYILYIVADILCARLPKQYPVAWKKSFLNKIPLPVYYAFCVFATISSCFLCYCYCIGMGWRDAVGIIIAVVIMTIYALFCLKTKRVTPEHLENQRNEILAEVAEYNT